MWDEADIGLARTPTLRNEVLWPTIEGGNRLESKRMKVDRGETRVDLLYY